MKVCTLHIQDKYTKKLERLSHELKIYDIDSLFEFLVGYYDYMKNYYGVYRR